MLFWRMLATLLATILFLMIAFRYSSLGTPMLLVIVLCSVIVASLALSAIVLTPLARLQDAADRCLSGQLPGAFPELDDRCDEIGHIARALRLLVSDLRRKAERNERFAAEVTHEIKNPLASLHSAMGAFHSLKDPDEQARLITVMEHDVRRLDRLVSELSKAARLDADLMHDGFSSFDLVVFLEALGEHLAAQAQAQGVDFFIDLPQAQVMIHGHEERLAQVIVNLVSNALSFSESGDAIRVWSRLQGHQVLIAVEDTGPGIPEEALSKVFRRFFSHRPPEQFGNNTGLGLAISKQIVQAHGGSIWAENIRPTELDATSAPMGARFVVGLPL